MIRPPPASVETTYVRSVVSSILWNDWTTWSEQVTTSYSHLPVWQQLEDSTLAAVPIDDTELAIVTEHYNQWHSTMIIMAADLLCSYSYFTPPLLLTTDRSTITCYPTLQANNFHRMITHIPYYIPQLSPVSSHPWRTRGLQLLSDSPILVVHMIDPIVTANHCDVIT